MPKTLEWLQTVRANGARLAAQDYPALSDDERWNFCPVCCGYGSLAAYGDKCTRCRGTGRVRHG